MGGCSDCAGADGDRDDKADDGAEQQQADAEAETVVGVLVTAHGQRALLEGLAKASVNMRSTAVRMSSAARAA